MANCNNVVCTFRRDTPVTVTIGFRTSFPAQRIQGTARVLFRGRWFPLRGGPEANVCNNLITGRCPMVAGASGTYRVTARIPFFAPPGTRTIVQVRAIDEMRRTISCFRVSAFIEA